MELSTEQKAEAYDRALKKASEFYNNEECRVGMTPVDLESIFPELKESEDERIRKEIVSAINIYCSEYSRGLKVRNDMLAWLEKQGEPVEINPTEFDTRLQTLIGKFDSLPKEELIGSISFWLNVVQNNGTYKPVEKQGENTLIEEIKRRKELLLCEKEKTTGLHESVSLGGRIAMLEELLAFVNKKQGEQKPTEWSKEDDQYVEDILALLSFGCSIHGITQVQDWLKSLKNRVQSNKN